MTSSVKRDKPNPHLIGDPDFPEGASVGVHYDAESDLPVSTRLGDTRRLIVDEYNFSGLSLFLSEKC
ncbi:MAG: hypothetical protein ACR2LN_07645 [Candidatus Levyibacteriota bacterium]